MPDRMRICFVLLPEARDLVRADLERAAAELFPDLGAPEWGEAQPGIWSFRLGGADVTAALMPAAVPNREADEATRFSYSGLSGDWKLPEHRAHLVVVQHPGDRSTLDSLTQLTRAAAALVRATNAVGVLWGEGRATHHPEFFVEIAQLEVPLMLWVGVSLARVKEGVELLSLGMKQLDLPDFLLRARRVDGETLDFFYDMLVYVAQRGEPLPEGNTIGRTAAERLPIRYTKSPISDEQVWVVELPE
jgi:hypothetical protein